MKAVECRVQGARRRVWGIVVDVTGNELQATGCKEDPCLGPAASDLRHETRRDEPPEANRLRFP